MAFYTNVSRLCAAEGISVNGLIVKLGMSKSNGKSWRNGAVPQASTLKKIADYFSVSVEHLVSEPQADEVSDAETVETEDRSKHVNSAHTILPVEDGMLQTLFEIYSGLDPIKKARLLLFANDLQEHNS